MIKNLKNNTTFIIGEAGCNHNGKIENAFKLIDLAKKTKLNAVKFQIFNPDLLVTKKANDDILKYKNDVIYELQDNIKLLEEATGNSVEYCDEEPPHSDNAMPAWDLSTIGSKSSTNTE